MCVFLTFCRCMFGLCSLYDTASQEEKERKMKFDINKMLEDLGGCAALAEQLGVSRNVPNGWRRRNYVSSVYLSKIKRVQPELDINQYFKEEVTDGDTGSSTRIP